MTAASTRRKWKLSGNAKSFHGAHDHARYAMVFLAFLDRAMCDPVLPPVARAICAGFRFAWGHLSDHAVDNWPKVDAEDPEPRTLTQRAVAEKIGMPESTLSEAASLLRRENYWHPTGETVYPDDQSTGRLFASSRARHRTSPLENKGGGSKSAPPKKSAISSPRGRVLEAEWRAAHPELTAE